MPVLHRLAAFVTTASVAALDASERAIQRDHTADCLIAGFAGRHTGEGRKLATLFDATPADRTALMAATIRLTEVDDIHLPSCTTPSSVVVPVALALASRSGAAHARMADAMYVGLELLTRLGAAVDGPSILYREVWPTYLCAPLAAAATAARALDLDVDATAVALSIALTLTAGGSGRFDQGASPRWLLHGVAVRSGLMAARAAQAGFAGDVDLLDRDWLAKSHGVALDLPRCLAGLGVGASNYSALSLKPFCSAKQAIAATQALADLIDQGIDLSQARRIVVHVPPAYAKMIDRRPEPGSRSSTFASARWQMALAAFRPEGLYDISRDAATSDDRMTDLMAKIEIVADAALAPVYPTLWPARVTVETAVGIRELTVMNALGDPGRRLNGAALSDKAQRVLSPLSGARTDHELRVAAHAIDDLEAAREAFAMFHAAG